MSCRIWYVLSSPLFQRLCITRLSPNNQLIRVKKSKVIHCLKKKQICKVNPFNNKIQTQIIIITVKNMESTGFRNLKQDQS